MRKGGIATQAEAPSDERVSPATMKPAKTLF